MTAVVEQIIGDSALTTSTKVVYLYIAASYRLFYYTNPHDCGSYEDLAKETNFSVSTVRRALKQLQEAGLIVVNSGSDKFESWLKVEILHLDEGLNLLRRLANAGDA